MTSEKKGFWFGGFENGLSIDPGMLDRFPEIEKLGRAFNDFQNSQYRGEWNQKTSLNYGDVRDLLREIARLLKHSQVMGDPSAEFIEISTVDGAGLYIVKGPDGWYAHMETPEMSVGPAASAQAALEALFKRKQNETVASDPQ